MKKIIIIISFFLHYAELSNAQNLIENPSFEKYWGGDCTSGSSLVFYNLFNATTPFGCTIKDWIRISETLDGFWFTGHDFPTNWLSNNLHPHSDSVCVGGAFYTPQMTNVREIIEGKLTKPLIADHHYQFGIYVQLFDKIPWNDVGKIVGTNSFSAVFTDTAIPSFQDLPIQNYTPQVQIDTMITDTLNWVLLMDTFIANGGEQYISIGNFKPNSLTQFQLVKTINASLPEISYYFMDDVSLIDLDDTTSGVEEQLAVKSNQLIVYPNPASQSIIISSKSSVNTIEVTDVLGRICSIPPCKGGKGDFLIDVSELPQGIYFIKTTDTKGNGSVGKFVKE